MIEKLKEVHLTVTEQNFVKESIEVLSIFDQRIEEKINEIISSLPKDKHIRSIIFLEKIFCLRYPVLYHEMKLKNNSFNLKIYPEEP